MRTVQGNRHGFRGLFQALQDAQRPVTGVRLTLTEHTDLRLQYERFTLEDTDLDMASAAVQYNF
ncbi:hypothetical protein [Halospina sp. K52047b]|uniref:hypothetical protein n=1 Tax=Halospina sp. K52047b TaxID=2614160 RepID=UPI00124A5062|nr:hypothetical protein [Halospina sp. K52047b]KAA8979258.1 hypothetical protein F3089_12765 [Halospina sp. K52047b]